MDLAFSPARACVPRRGSRVHRDTSAGGHPGKVKAGDHLVKDDYYRWHRILHERGWVAPNWPVEYGGPDWTPVQRHIFYEELAYGWAPRLLPFGLSMVAPVIIEFGNDAQKARYLPTIHSGEEFWCQGYSEPGAGSDLASLSTRAERTGYLRHQRHEDVDHRRAMGRLDLRAGAHRSGREEARGHLVHPGRHATPGVTVRPIETIDGGNEINEVHFENVEVPARTWSAQGAGWTYAKFLLEHERTGTAGIAGCRQHARAAATSWSPRTIDDRRLRRTHRRGRDRARSARVHRVAHARGGVGRQTPRTRVLDPQDQRHRDPAGVSELALDALGPYAEQHLAPKYFNYRKTSIYAGSNEIQKNIIAKRILKL